MKRLLHALSLVACSLLSACIVSTERLPSDEGPFQYSDNQADIYYSDGRVGLGTDSPVEALDVHARASVFGTLPGKLTLGSSGMEYPSIGYNTVYSESAGGYTYRAKDGASLLLLGDYYNGFVFLTTPVTGGLPGSPINFGIPAAVLTRAGSLGINTNAPSDRLHVGKGGGIRLDAERPPENTDPEIQERSFRFRVNGQTHYDTLLVGAFSADGAAYSDLLSIHADGNVGVGTTLPTAPLEVAARTIGTAEDVLYLNQKNQGSYGYVFKIDNVESGDLYIQRRESGVEPSDELLTFSSDGRLGIGTDKPIATLDVNGTMRLSKHSSAPFACDSAHDATIALTSQYGMCVCIGGQAKWAPTTNPGGTCSW